MISGESSVFERNVYYKSKLLTADDFEMEQSYFLNKHKNINELLYCGGVVSGLRVTGDIGSSFVTVSPGMAIDYMGREIVVPAEETFDLNPQSYTNGCAYLYLEYLEETTYVTLAAFGQGASKKQANKVTEKFQLGWYELDEYNKDFGLRDELNGDSIYWDRRRVYFNKGLLITQSVPKYVMANKIFEIKVEIMLVGDVKDIMLSYEISAGHITGLKNETYVKVDFSDKNFVKTNKYSMMVPAFATIDMAASEIMNILPGTFYLQFNGSSVGNAPEVVTWEIGRIGTNVREYLRDYYLSHNTKSPAGDKHNKLYLAKVTLDKINKITGVFNLPFEQYLDSWRLNSILQGILPTLASQGEMLTESTVRKIVDEYKSEYKKSIKQIIEILPEVTSGSITAAINYKNHLYKDARTLIYNKLVMDSKEQYEKKVINPNLKNNEKYELIEMLHICDRNKPDDYITEPEILKLVSADDKNIFKTEMINHGFGEADSVQILCAVSGDTQKSDVPLSIELTAVLNDKKDRFYIGGRILERTDIDSVLIMWSAHKKSSDSVFSIYPRIIQTNINTDVQLLCCINGKKTTPKWTVSGNASIDANNVFNASAVGTIEITAETNYQNEKLLAHALAFVE